MGANLNDINRIAEKYLYGNINIAANHTHSFGTPVFTDRNAPPGTLYGMSGAIYAHPDTLTPKGPPMTTLDKMRLERKEQRERERIERIYAGFDDLGLDTLTNGWVFVFTWLPEPDKPYTYAALKTNDKWYVTGRESPNGLDTEDFVAWMIEKDIYADDLEGRAAA